MKKIVISVLLIALSYGMTSAQKNHHERVRAYKTAYLTQELDLTPDEAEKFWPVYNAYERETYENKVLKVKKEIRRIDQQGGPDSLSDKEARETLSGFLKNEKEVLQSRESLYKDLEKVLPPAKLLKLYKAERDFNKRLLSEFRRKRPTRPDSKPDGGKF